MGVKDFYAAVTPSSRSYPHAGRGVQKTIHDKDIRSEKIFAEQSVVVSSQGGLLNQVLYISLYMRLDGWVNYS